MITETNAFLYLKNNITPKVTDINREAEMRLQNQSENKQECKQNSCPHNYSFKQGQYEDAEKVNQGFSSLFFLSLLQSDD